MTRIAPLPVALALAFSMFASRADATSITFDLNYVYTGAQPGSALSWLTFTFRDTTDCSPGPCAADKVQLLMVASLEAGSEFITQTNFNSALPLSSIAYTSGTGSFKVQSISPYDPDEYNAGAHILFDVQADFSTSNSNGGSKRFNGTDTALFTITGTGINANTFNVPTPIDGTKPRLWASAHVQGISETGCGTSGWIGDRNGTSSGGQGATCGTTKVPDSGSTLALLGMAMVGVGYLRRRRS